LSAQGNCAHQAGDPSAKNCDLHAAPYSLVKVFRLARRLTTKYFSLVKDLVAARKNSTSMAFRQRRFLVVNQSPRTLQNSLARREFTLLAIRKLQRASSAC
jgi:hypothetical protein